jgi:tetratricopeptide (TPR) repeat protein
MFSSEKAVVFPVILIALEISFFSLRKNWKRILPFVGIATFGAAALLSNWGGRVSTFQNEFLVKPVWLNPLATIPTSLFWYLRLIFFPDKLSIYHPEVPLSPAMWGLQVAVAATFLIALMYCFFRQKRIFFWLFWFFITLTPTFLPMRLAWVVAERYVYLGTAGIVVLVGWGVSVLIRSKYSAYGYVLAVVIVLSLLTRTIMRNQDWQDTDSLWIATGKTAPEYHVTHNNLGDMYGRWGDPQRAIQEFLLATKIKPDYAEGYHNAGNTYLQLGDLQNAKKYFDLAVKYNPRIWQTHQDLAIIYFNGKKYKEALHELEIAIKLSPQDAALYENLAITYDAMGDTAKAAYVRQHAPRMQ